MEEYKSYNPQTGDITGTLVIQPETLEHYLARGESLIKFDGDGESHYVDVTQSPPVVKPRPVMSVTQDKSVIQADGRDAVTLSHLPVPCSVRVGGREYNVGDGELEWATLMPGSCEIRVKAFSYQDWESGVTAVACSTPSE